MTTQTDLTNIVLDMIQTGTDGTLSASGDSLPTRGYWVGGMFPSLIDPVSVEELEDFLHMTTRVFDVEYIGVWTDTETGRVYIDAVQHESDVREALTLASRRGELAIWDIMAGVEIRTGQ